MNDIQAQALGARNQAGGVAFCVWSPETREMAVVFGDERRVPMEKDDEGYFTCTVEGIGAGTRYGFAKDGGDVWPDPASRCQPEGIHGLSEVIDPSAYVWHDDDWGGVPREQLVFYEIHTGTFSPKGTFGGVRERLPYLAALGVTALELMPVTAFPGRWNWGYDPAALFAPSHTYGTPDDLRALVDDAHRHGLAVFLDVVYNHLGPDGAYVASYAPMLTRHHRTPWGTAINLDDHHSRHVRRFLIDNALHWLREYHVDGFRLDATQTLVDDGSTHFLAELSQAVATVDGPPRHVVAEDLRNLARLIEPRDRGGYALDALWVDDFHHQLRVALTGDASGYFAPFAGSTLRDVATTLERGWTLEHHPPSSAATAAAPPRSPDRCVFYIQNHDQVGNLPNGARLTHVVDLPAYRALTALLLFAPQLPLLFMGQEWAASTPFQFFTDHHEKLGKKVRAGRRREMKALLGRSIPVPDPQDPATFERSRLRWQERATGDHGRVLRLYHDLLAFRRRLGGPATAEAPGAYTLSISRGKYCLYVCLGDEASVPCPPAAQVVLHTEQPGYTSDPRPPAFGSSTVTFHRPGAVVTRIH